MCAAVYGSPTGARKDGAGRPFFCNLMLQFPSNAVGRVVFRVFWDFFDAYWTIGPALEGMDTA